MKPAQALAHHLRTWRQSHYLGFRDAGKVAGVKSNWWFRAEAADNPDYCDVVTENLAKAMTTAGVTFAAESYEVPTLGQVLDLVSRLDLPDRDRALMAAVLKLLATP